MGEEGGPGLGTQALEIFLKCVEMQEFTELFQQAFIEQEFMQGTVVCVLGDPHRNGTQDHIRK